MTIKKQLDEIVDKTTGDTPLSYAREVARKAYELGKASKKCKEEDDNPYNIDHARQTKLDL